MWAFLCGNNLTGQPSLLVKLAFYKRSPDVQFAKINPTFLTIFLQIKRICTPLQKNNRQIAFFFRRNAFKHPLCKKPLYFTIDFLTDKLKFPFFAKIFNSERLILS